MVEISTRPMGVSAEITIAELKCLFSIHGLPQQIVSDNGPQFVSDQFAQFLKQNGIKHFRSLPYHPSSKGLTKPLIQTLKKALRAYKEEGTVQQRLASFCCLTEHRLMPPQKRSHVSC